MEHKAKYDSTLPFPYKAFQRYTLYTYFTHISDKEGISGGKGQLSKKKSSHICLPLTAQ